MQYRVPGTVVGEEHGKEKSKIKFGKKYNLTGWAFPLYYMLCGATNASIDVVRGRLYPGLHLAENFKTLLDVL